MQSQYEKEYFVRMKEGKMEGCKQPADALQSSRPTSATFAAVELENFRKPVSGALEQSKEG